MAKYPYGKISYGEISLRQKLLTAKFPTAKFLTAKFSYGEISLRQSSFRQNFLRGNFLSKFPITIFSHTHFPPHLSVPHPSIRLLRHLISLVLLYPHIQGLRSTHGHGLRLFFMYFPLYHQTSTLIITYLAACAKDVQSLAFHHFCRLYN